MQTQYHVVITKAGTDGFIDDTTIEKYMQANSNPTDYAACVLKEKANIRFDFLQQQLQRETNVYITNITKPSATADAAPDTFAFDATVEHGDGALFTPDEANPGQFLTGMDALKRWVARALVTSRTTFGDIYDPTPTTAPGQTNSVPRVGVRSEMVTVTAVAADLTAANLLVTVSQI